jgi:hypothetical protein
MILLEGVELLVVSPKPYRSKVIKQKKNPITGLERP